jgi:3-hydroxyisobutyrate dehydrogenase-like beta-hydroxyacid dehydrogenase
MAVGFSRVALIGFGEVGQTLGPDLLSSGASVTAYDPLFANPKAAPSRALKKIHVAAAKTPSEAVKHAELVISAVPAASDIEAARSVVPGLPRGALSGCELGFARYEAGLFQDHR